MVFEIELIRQIEINIDYILMLVKKYHDTHCEDKEVLITINKAIDASPELRSKKKLIETFIAGINDVDDVMNEWHSFVAEQRDQDLAAIIMEEKLKPEDTRKFMENAFQMCIRDSGYRVQSQIATRFRRWATIRLHEYIQKGFSLDDDRLKQGGSRYFRELLQRIRDCLLYTSRCV